MSFIEPVKKFTDNIIKLIDTALENVEKISSSIKKFTEFVINLIDRILDFVLRSRNTIEILLILAPAIPLIGLAFLLISSI